MSVQDRRHSDPPPGTNHAHHFLSRLDRVSSEETALALALYRDPAILRYVIDQAAPDPASERVAVSLAGPDGPFVVVTREARFVTCLARGMDPYDTAVVTREDLDRCAVSFERLRTAIERARVVSQDSLRVHAAFQAIYSAGDRLTREDMEVVLGMRALMLSRYVRNLLDTDDHVVATLDLLRRRTRYRADEHDRLLHVWQSAWAVGHLLPLLADESLEESRRYSGIECSLEQCFADFAWSGVRLGNTALALRGVWCAARMGRCCVGHLEAQASAAPTHVEQIGSIWAMVGAAVRYPELRERVERRLASVASSGQPYIDGIAAKAAAALRDRLADGAGWERRAVETLRAGAFLCGAPNDFDRYDDDAVLAWHACYEVGVRDPQAPDLLAVLVPWFAVREPEAMYQREAVARRLQIPWDVAASELLVEHYRRLWASDVPVRVAPTPGRNEPCSCGSGRKFKKCCGGLGRAG
jgi:hypothetical protein